LTWFDRNRLTDNGEVTIISHTTSVDFGFEKDEAFHTPVSVPGIAYHPEPLIPIISDQLDAVVLVLIVVRAISSGEDTGGIHGPVGSIKTDGERALSS